MSEPVMDTRAPTGAGMEERRSHLRRRVLKGATLEFNRGFGAFECVVRNISDGGARLSFGDALGVPARFDLRVGPDGEWRHAEVRWRGPSDVGVAFVTAG